MTAPSQALACTVESVVDQSALARHHIRCVIRCADTQSEFGPELGSLLDTARQRPRLDLVVVRQQDRGLYDAVSAELSAARTGDYDACAYIGAGDYYSPHAFDIVAEVMSQHDVDWLTGLICTYNSRQHLLRARLPFAYRPSLIRCGAYGRWLPFIQQESTFWSPRLHQAVDFDRLASLKLAGDYYLWRTFAEVSRLAVVEAWLAGFEVRPGQLSQRLGVEYAGEFASLATPCRVRDALNVAVDKVLWSAPYRVVKRLAPDLLTYDHPRAAYVRRSAGTSRRASERRHEG